MDIQINKNFFTRDFIDNILDSDLDSICHDRLDFEDKWGVFKGEITDILWHMDVDSPFSQNIIKELKNVDLINNHRVEGVCVHHHLFPYDVHSDLITSQNGVPIIDHIKHTPSYTALIPLSEHPDCATVIFNQCATRDNAFQIYKEDNEPLDEYIDDDIWNKYCNHCHDEDQKYLTLKEIIKWNIGDLYLFHRKLFHAGANFTKKKKSVIIRLSEK